MPRSRWPARKTEAQLHLAIESRDVIGMAKGILMERHDLDAVQAFRMLVETSQSTQLKLHEVAAWLIEHRGSLDRRTTPRPLA